MVSDQDADIPLAQVPDDPLDVEDGYRVYAGEGFVKQHEQGIRCECPCDFDTASLATRQTNSEARTNVADVELIEQLLEFLLPSCSIEIVPVLENGEDVVLDTEFPEDRCTSARNSA